MTKTNPARVRPDQDGWGAFVDRTAESVRVVVRDWDVNVSVLLDDNGEVRVRVYDPRDPFSPIATMFRGNVYEVLADTPPLSSAERDTIKWLRNAMKLDEAVEDVFDDEDES